MKAVARAFATVPGKTLAHYRIPRKTVALRVFSTGCEACNRFESNRLSFERSLGADLVVDLNADLAVSRTLALKAGVKQIPSYIVLSPGGRTELVNPLSTASASP